MKIRTYQPIIHFVTLATLVVLGPGAAQAQTQVFIGARTGTDSGVCSVAAPCRNVNYALTQVVAGGEVNIIESGDYAPTFITRSVTVQAAPGVIASFSAAAGPIVTINAGSADVVRLRGLTLDGQNAASYGVAANTAAAVQIDRLVVKDFTSHGIALNNSNGRNTISDTVVTNCNVGIGVGITTFSVPFVTVTATIENCRVERCQTGYSASSIVNAYTTTVTIRNSSANHCTSQGFNAAGTSSAIVRLNLENILAAHNGAGVQSALGATTRVSNSTIVNNTTGLSTGGSLLSRLNNTVEGNNTNGAFTGTFAAK